jgi:hypothetical protein
MSDPDADPERDMFYKWIGHCITAWADLEERLFEILWQCLSCPQARAAIVYYKTPSIDARLTLTDELVRSVLPKTESGKQPHPDLKAWNDIRLEITTELAVRRRIAHRPVREAKLIFDLTATQAFRGKHQVEMSYYEIYVSEHEALRGKGGNPKPLHFESLLDHQTAVGSTVARLKAFRNDVLSKHVPKLRAQRPRKTRG